MNPQELHKELQRLRKESPVPNGYTKILDGMVDLMEAEEKTRLQSPVGKKWPHRVAMVDPTTTDAFGLSFDGLYTLIPGERVQCSISDAVFLEGIDLGGPSEEVNVFIDEECLLSATTQKAGHISLRPQGFGLLVFQAWDLNSEGHADIKQPLGFFLTTASILRVEASCPVTCQAALYTTRWGPK